MEKITITYREKDGRIFTISVIDECGITTKNTYEYIKKNFDIIAVETF